MYLRLFLIVVFSLELSFVACSQNKQLIDSLEKILPTISQDTTKSKVLATLTQHYQMTDLPKAIEYGKQCVEHSTQANNEMGSIICHRNLGYAYMLNGEYTFAMDYMYRTLAKAEKAGRRDLVASAWVGIGMIYFEERAYPKSLMYFDKALAIYQTLPNQEERISFCKSRIGKVQVESKEYKKSLENLQFALEHSYKVGNESRVVYVLNVFGENYLAQKQYDKALSYFKQAQEAHKAKRDYFLISTILNNIGKTYLQKKQLDSAKIACEDALKIAQKVHSKQEISENYACLCEVANQKQEWEKALTFFRKATAIKDSLFYEGKNRLFVEIQTVYEVESQKQQINTQQSQINKQNTLLYVSMVVIVLVLLLAFTFYKLTLQQRKGNELLTEKNDELSRKNAEIATQKTEIQNINENLEDILSKRTQQLEMTVESLVGQNQDLEQFSYIISHNIRSPIAQIQGLLSLYNKKNPQDEFNQQIISHLETSSQNLNTVITDLNQILNIRKSLDKTKEKVSLQEVTKSVAASLAVEISQADAEITTDFAQAEVLFSIKSYLYSIIYNLVSNAIKYRSSKRRLKIHLQIRRVEGEICLSIADNGIGISLENTDLYKIFGLYQRMHDHVEGKGLGLYLVKTQVETLKGRVEVSSQIDEGTTFEIYFKE